MVSEHWHLLSACRPSLPAFPLAFSLRFAAEKKPVAFAAHEHCVLWSKRMTVSSSGAIHPPAVGNVVRKGVQRRCTICSGFGATVECSGKAKGGCPIVYHFECANASKKIALDMVEYRCFCVNHARGRASVEFQRVKIAPGEYVDLSAKDDDSDSDEEASSQKPGGHPMSKPKETGPKKSAERPTSLRRDSSTDKATRPGPAAPGRLTRPSRERAQSSSNPPKSPAAGPPAASNPKKRPASEKGGGSSGAAAPAAAASVAASAPNPKKVAKTGPPRGPSECDATAACSLPLYCGSRVLVSCLAALTAGWFAQATKRATARLRLRRRRRRPQMQWTGRTRRPRRATATGRRRGR